jgi:hypothetical protein
MRRQEGNLVAREIVVRAPQNSAPPKNVSLKKPTGQFRSGAPAPEESYDVSALVRGTVAGLTDKATRGFMTDETIALLRSECPGWDLYNLHAEFERWVNADTSRAPVNWQKAFVGYVRRWHEKHRHELRR